PRPPHLSPQPVSQVSPSAAAFARAQALHQAGRLAEAQALYDQVLQADPRHSGALHYLGYLWFQKGDTGRALGLIGRAVELAPKDPGIRYNRGLILKQAGRLDEAVADFRHVAALAPSDLGAWAGLGETLLALGRPEEALGAYDRALALKPDAVDFHANRAVALRGLGRLEEALAAQDRVMASAPGYAEGWSNRGNVLKDLGRFEEAVQSFDRSVAINPRLPLVLVNRANALRELGRIAEAMAGYDGAIVLAPAYPSAHHHRGVLLTDQQRLPEAVAAFDRALALVPGDAASEGAKAMALLMAGDFERGLPLYERRPMLAPEAAWGCPPWLGAEPVDGKTVLVWAEQGLGDTLQFCRYVPLLAERGARVVLRAQRPLLPLLASLAGVEALIAADEPPPAFDLHTPLLSLPLAFGARLDTIPASAAYLTPDPARVQTWSQRLGPRSRPRIGLVWSGRAEHSNDRRRTLPLARLLAALPPGFDYISLQQEVRPADQATLASRPDIRHFGSELKDFADTAALVWQMDAVVGVDTSVAHLAGALGKDTRLLLSRPGQDWRWLTERSDTPWYPTMRLYRQGADGDWAGPLAAVGSELAGA
ncbi:MAG TPA: tetratricopeptide repeat protein, partial [Caulobacteraceae bacterium]